MLETVRASIAELPDTSFEQHFQEYVMMVQDLHISAEIQQLLHHNSLDIVVMSKIIRQNYGRSLTNDTE